MCKYLSHRKSYLLLLGEQSPPLEGDHGCSLSGHTWKPLHEQKDRWTAPSAHEDKAMANYTANMGFRTDAG